MVESIAPKGSYRVKVPHRPLLNRQLDLIWTALLPGIHMSEASVRRTPCLLLHIPLGEACTLYNYSDTQPPDLGYVT